MMKSSLPRSFDSIYGFVLAVLCIFNFCYFVGATPSMLIHIGPIIAIFIASFGVCIMTFGSQNYFGAIANAFSLMCSAEPHPLSSAECVIFRTWGRVVYLIAFITVLISVAIILSFLNAPLAIIGGHLVSTVLEPFYALLFNVLIIQPILSRNEWLAAGGNGANSSK